MRAVINKGFALRAVLVQKTRTSCSRPCATRAVRNEGRSLVYADMSYKSNVEIVRAAVDQDRQALLYALVADAAPFRRAGPFQALAFVRGMCIFPEELELLIAYMATSKSEMDFWDNECAAKKMTGSE